MNKENMDKIVENLTYFNVFEGDDYRYKPRGYLYMIGRKQYWDLYENEIPSSKTILKYPETAAGSEVQAFKTAFLVWTKLKDKNGKTSYDYTSREKVGNDVAGRSTTFNQTIISSQQLNANVEDSFNKFEKILNIFVGKDRQPLIDYFKP